MLNVSGVGFSADCKSNFADKAVLKSQTSFKRGKQPVVVHLLSENPSRKEIIKTLKEYAKKTKYVFLGHKKKIADMVTGAADKPLIINNLNYLLSNESVAPEIMTEVLEQSKKIPLNDHNTYEFISAAYKKFFDLCNDVLSCMIQKN